MAQPLDASRLPSRRISTRRTWIVAALLCGLPALIATADDGDSDNEGVELSGREIHGYVERIRIEPEGVTLSARMDTGATSSSLNAINQRRFRRGGDRWIEFDIVDPEDEDETIRFQRPIERFVRILRHEGEQRRPVVKMTFCIGSKLITADTSLIDRSNLSYQALVGRAHLAGEILLDSEHRYLMEPECDADAIEELRADPDD